jgi:PAS domain S-box-containing protein
MIFLSCDTGSITPSPSFVKKLSAAVILLNLLLYCLAGISLYSSRNSIESQIRTSTRNLVKVFETSFHGVFEKADLALLNIADEAELHFRANRGDGKELSRHISRHSSRIPELEYILFADEKGFITDGSGVEGDFLKNVVTHDFFTLARDNPRPEMVVSKPFVDPGSKKWVLAISRRVNNPDGSFAGIVFGSFPIEFFTKLFSTIDLGKNGAVALRDSDLNVVARIPEPKGFGSSIGMKASDEAIQAVRGGKTLGTYTGRSKIENITRTFSFVKLTNLPLYIAVGLATDDYYAEWKQHLIIILTILAIFSITTLLMANRVLASWKKMQTVQAGLEAMVQQRTADLCAKNTMLVNEAVERKQAEESLLKSEEKLRNVFDRSSTGKSITSVDGVLNVNQALSKLLGYSKEELANKRWQEITHPDDIELTNSHISRLLSGSLETVEFNKRYIKKDGSIVWAELQAILQRDAEGKPEYYITTITDITDKIKTEEALKKSGLFIEGILESVDEGFAIIGKDYRITSANKAFLDNYGVTADEVVGKHCYEVSHHIEKPCYENGVECSVKSTFETGLPSKCLHTHYDKAGKPCYHEMKSYPMKDSEGNVTAAIEICIDVTEKRNLEGQLRQSQKMEAIGLLAGGVAHDFNNILTAIIGYSTLTRNKLKDDDPLQHNIEQVITAAERATVLTQGLLTFSRKQEVHLSPTDLNSIVRKVDKFLTRIIGEDVQLTITTCDNALIVEADTGQLEQVLMNLATNARDAMPTGGTLWIETGTLYMDDNFCSAHGYGKPGHYAFISVTDTGVGIDENKRDKIFEPFFTTKELGKGTGLGLSIIYGIIKQHEGYINCYSEVGKGTTFKIYLPITHGFEADTPTTATVPSFDRGKETILFAEDDDLCRNLFSELMSDLGYRVIEAINGEDAICKFALYTNEIDLVILDTIMPVKSGKEALDGIKKIKPDIKVLFISGYPDDFINKSRLVDDGISFIGKPFSPIEFLQKVRREIDGK